MNGCHSTRLLNICVWSLCRCGNLDRADSVIVDAIRIGIRPDPASHDTLIATHSHFNRIHSALSALRRMRHSGLRPSLRAYNALLSASSRLRLPDLSLDLLADIPSPDACSYNTLLHCLFRSGRPSDALRVFDSMRVPPSHITYNTILDGLCRSHGNVSNAVRLLRHLERSGSIPPTRVDTYNVVIAGLCRSGRLRQARKMLAGMPVPPNVITYTTVMRGCFRYKMFHNGFQLFDEMRSKGIAPDLFAYCTVIGALVKAGKTDEAYDCIERMLNYASVSMEGELDVHCYNTVLNAYCKTGALDEAFKLVGEMVEAGMRTDEYTHTILIDGLCRAGRTDEATQIHAQRWRHVEEWSSEEERGGLVASNCLIDRLCKEGEVDWALRVFRGMGVRDAVTYTAMVHGLCSRRRFHSAFEMVMECLRGGLWVPCTVSGAVLDGLTCAGYRRDARVLRSAIRIAKILKSKPRGE
ncbi:Pentatricopeptide repeat-containing protein [Acorus calamus]|uniref:Pentatricopeptide repeat-containing protein n=1 Tax=Acorus calamus TaxID=4465 RepID=A0AAV9CYM7_ACOCL|nr:Pentatricopeptide repeat-containing protein [Acorus calamus]